MKKIITILVLLAFFGLSIQGQNQYKVTGRNFDGTPTFIKFQEKANLTVENFFDSMKEEFKFSSDDSMEMYKTTSDKLGFKLYRYHQNYKKIQIYGAEYLLHEKEGKIKTANGKIFLGLSIDVNPSIKEEEAFENALQYLGEKKYRWQDSLSEQALKKKTKNPNATYYPKGKLVIAPLNGEYKKDNFYLCWMFNIAGDRLDKAWTVFIDAHDGKLINKISEIDDADVTGSAKTQYNGTQTITSFYNSSDGLYYLYENGTRGPTQSQEIITVNMNGDATLPINWSAAQYITNTSATWTTKPVSCQAHWNLENTYDYYYNLFNRNSVDDAGYPLWGLVHFDINLNNAFWDPTDTVMVFGDGDGSFMGPVVGLDVTGHEVTHGVTFFTAKLTNKGETGALNESFSDIMGTGVEIYTLGSGANWTIGENVVLTPPYYLRSMSDPKANAVGSEQPNTYGGQYWAPTGASDPDNGGVHTNDGVQNYWFYLLTNGGSGVNDNGSSYKVNGIGIDTALAIAYRTLTSYLTPISVYSDAVLASEQAAEDFSFANSYEVQNVDNAWCAVGLHTCRPIANFNSNTTSICVGNSINFYDLSDNNPTSWSWNFGDGGTSIVKNPIHTYNISGTFDIILTVTNAGGSDIYTASAYITVNPLPSIASAPIGSTTLCVNAANTNYTTTGAANATSYLWSITPSGAGTITGTGTTGTVNWNNTFTGTATITVKGVNSCGNGTSSAGLTVTINPLPSIAATPTGNTTLCVNAANTNYTTTGAANATTYLWSITPSGAGTITGTGTTGTVDWNNTFTGTVSITVKGNNSCGAGNFSNALIVTINALPPVPTITQNVNTLVSSSAIGNQWYNSSGAISGQTNQTFNPPQDGIYYVIVTDANGCSSQSASFNFVATGIETITWANEFNLFPNPSDGSFTLTITDKNIGNYSFTIYNLIGEKIWEQVNIKPLTTIFNINLQKYSEGIYFMQINSDKGSFTKKIIINK